MSPVAEDLTSFVLSDKGSFCSPAYQEYSHDSICFLSTLLAPRFFRTPALRATQQYLLSSSTTCIPVDKYPQFASILLFVHLARNLNGTLLQHALHLASVYQGSGDMHSYKEQNLQVDIQHLCHFTQYFSGSFPTTESNIQDGLVARVLFALTLDAGIHAAAQIQTSTKRLPSHPLQTSEGMYAALYTFLPPPICHMIMQYTGSWSDDWTSSRLLMSSPGPVDMQCRPDCSGLDLFFANQEVWSLQRHGWRYVVQPVSPSTRTKRRRDKRDAVLTDDVPLSSSILQDILPPDAWIQFQHKTAYLEQKTREVRIQYAEEVGMVAYLIVINADHVCVLLHNVQNGTLRVTMHVFVPTSSFWGGSDYFIMTKVGRLHQWSSMCAYDRGVCFVAPACSNAIACWDETEQCIHVAYHQVRESVDLHQHKWILVSFHTLLDHEL
jgi:hypothetical protein